VTSYASSANIRSAIRPNWSWVANTRRTRHVPPIGSSSAAGEAAAAGASVGAGKDVAAPGGRVATADGAALAVDGGADWAQAETVIAAATPSATARKPMRVQARAAAAGPRRACEPNSDPPDVARG
jgi:hypothetical protein